MSEQQQSQLKKLIARGKEKGFLTYAEVNDHLPDDIVDPEQIEDIIAMINDMGIEVHEFVPDTETLLLNENPASADDDVVAEEAAAALESSRSRGPASPRSAPVPAPPAAHPRPLASRPIAATARPA